MRGAPSGSRAFAPVRDSDWIVAIEQRKDEAYDPYKIVLYSLYAIIALFALGALILGGLTRSSVVTPLVLLTYAVRRRRDGYPFIGTPVKRRDEIGELADAFVEMDQTLAERQRDLEITLDLQRHLIEDNPLAIAVIDAEYRIVQSNKAWASLLLPEQSAELSATHAGAQIFAWLKAHPNLQVVDDLAIEDAEGVMRYWDLHKAELRHGHRGKVLLVVEGPDSASLARTALHAGRKAIGARGDSRRRSARNQKPPRHCAKHLRSAASVRSRGRKGARRDPAHDARGYPPYR